MRKWMLVLMLGLLVGFAAGCGNETTDASPSSSEETTPEKTEGESAESTLEGTLNFYTSQPDADAAKLAEEFENKYPDVKVEIFRSGTEEVISKIKAEKMAGEVQADVLLVADSVTFESLKEEEMLQEYETDQAAEIPSELIDPDHTYYGTKAMATALVVNTKNVKEMPNSWNVLTSEEAKGKVMMPSPLYSGAAAYNLGVLTRQDNFGWDFYQNIAANDVTVTKGNGDVLKGVAGGEENYGMVVDFIVARAKAEGSPVELVYPEEGVPVITEPIGIMKNAQNEEAAKAFVDFVLSEDGQKLAAELGYTPIRKGVEAPEGLKTIDEMKVISSDVHELYKSREDDKKEFETVVGE